ncbi:MAG: CBS domain-containing protein [Phycisphaerales bacterium]|nr:CBS domain-containing protein [Phycisphaerales bacterium]
MTLETIMSRHVISVDPDAELYSVRELLNKFHIHHVLVIERCRLVGVISDRDILANLSPFVGKHAERSQDAWTTHRHAHQFMTRNPITATPEMPIADAALILLNSNISCLPIVDAAGAVVGVVTWRDFLRWTLGDLTDKTCRVQLAADTANRDAA